MIISVVLMLFLLTGMKSGASHDYSATIGPFKDTLVPGIDNELKFLMDGKELMRSPNGWKYSLGGDGVTVLNTGDKTLVNCEETKKQHNAVLLIRIDMKVVFKKCILSL